MLADPPANTLSP
ncbi:hypothetical protein YPPY94_0498, partial [Yersinia pestis PY-94]